MKVFYLICFIICSQLMNAQSNIELIEEITKYQVEHSEEFENPETSILDPEDLAEFHGLEFFPIDLKYRVKATWVRTPNEKPFKMPTTTTRLPEYVKYGEAHFTIDGESFKLNVYQNVELSAKNEEYKDYLFIPFTDYTSGDGSYGGGRYLDARIPEGSEIIIDFNRAYNPYCAYSARYSCPIPPKENDLLVRIEAGVKDFGKH